MPELIRHDWGKGTRWQARANRFGYHLMPHYRVQAVPRGAARSPEPHSMANKHIKDVPQKQLLRPKGRKVCAGQRIYANRPAYMSEPD